MNVVDDFGRERATAREQQQVEMFRAEGITAGQVVCRKHFNRELGSTQCGCCALDPRAIQSGQVIAKNGDSIWRSIFTHGTFSLRPARRDATQSRGNHHICDTIQRPHWGK